VVGKGGKREGEEEKKGGRKKGEELRGTRTWTLRRSDELALEKENR